MRILTTDRLILRPLSADDFAALCQTLQDEKAMYAYGHAFSDEEVQAWLMRQIARGARPGFGLRAVIRRADGAFLGQCGITVQQWGKLSVPEIGYLFARRYWHNGYRPPPAAMKRSAHSGAGRCMRSSVTAISPPAVLRSASECRSWGRRSSIITAYSCRTSSTAYAAWKRSKRMNFLPGTLDGVPFLCYIIRVNT